MNPNIALDLRTVWALLRGQPRHGTHADRLQRFYASQASRYDAFRDNLLHGRRELIDAMLLPTHARILEMGAGTGRNLDYFGERLHEFRSVDLVDLCPALLTRARIRARRLSQSGVRTVRVIEADASAYRSPYPLDCVYFSYALTMIPDWTRAIDNAIDQVAPGGLIGVVDFHLPHGEWSNAFWKRWFAHDGVRLSSAHLPYLQSRLRTQFVAQARGDVPFLPGLRAPYYVFVGRKLERAGKRTSHVRP